MKRTIWTFGLISGAILSAMLALTAPFVDSIGFDRGHVIGFTTVVLASLLVFFGVRSYRDNVAGGTIGFGRAFAVGSLITVIACLCYMATWELLFFKFTPEYATKFHAMSVEKAKADSDSPEELQKKLADIEKFTRLYQNPAFNAAVTFLEPMPAGLVFALVSAGVLSRKRRSAQAMLATSIA